MKTTHAVWERENIGVDAWEIALDAQDTIEALAEEEKRIIAEGAEYIVLKSPVNCPKLLFGLPELGYTYVETVFHVEIRRKDYHMPDIIARFDRGLTVVERTDPENQARIDRIIRSGIFISDRVSIDPAFSVSLGGRRYANWLRSMVEKGGRLYEVLMAMYDQQNDRGLGALLHKKTLDTCFTHECRRLTSTIVSNNSKVLRVYVNAGATISDTLYTYVKHVKR